MTVVDQFSLAVRGLTVGYATPGGQIEVVRDVDLAVARGRTVGLVGESGSGKSSLGRGIMGLLPEGGTVSGSVLLSGEEQLDLPAEQRRARRGSRIGLVFQEPMTRLDPLMRVSEHFLEALRAHEPRIRRAEARRRALSALRAVGIPPTRFDLYPHEFSGGMRQRIMIALVLVADPDVIIADEATTALDVLVEAQIVDLLADVKAAGTSLVFITHNLGLVARVCDDVAVMYAGRIVERGPVAEVFANPAHPYTKMLLGSTISLETTELAFIPGAPPSAAALPSGCSFHPRCPLATDVCRERVPVPRDFGPERTVECWHAEEVGHDAEVLA